MEGGVLKAAQIPGTDASIAGWLGIYILLK